jgi:hypothetical protein
VSLLLLFQSPASGSQTTVKAAARAWAEVSSTATWTARSLWDTGTALYAVVQDTGATPKVRVMKADDRINPTTWTEQDSGDNKSITNVDYPFSSWLHTNGDLHIVAMSATNTLTHYLFDTDTDQWITGYGNVTTFCENEHSVRVVVRSDGDVFVFYTSSADDADIFYSIWNGSTWSGDLTILTATSANASSIIDSGVDSTDRTWVVYYDASGVDVTYVTISSSDVVSTPVDIEAFGPTSGSQNAGAGYTLYDDGGTDKIIVTYLDDSGNLSERTVTLESDAASGNLSTEVLVESLGSAVGTRTPVSTAVVGSVPYAAWWDDAASGTIYYSTKSGGTWAARSAFATGITRLVEIVPVGSDGLGVVYQSSSDVMFDWLITSTGAEPVVANDSQAIITSEGSSLVTDIPRTDNQAIGSSELSVPNLLYVDSQIITASEAWQIGIALSDARAIGSLEGLATDAVLTLADSQAIGSSESASLDLIQKNATDSQALSSAEATQLVITVNDSQAIGSAETGSLVVSLAVADGNGIYTSEYAYEGDLPVSGDDEPFWKYLIP